MSFHSQFYAACVLNFRFSPPGLAIRSNRTQHSSRCAARIQTREKRVAHCVRVRLQMCIMCVPAACLYVYIYFTLAERSPDALGRMQTTTKKRCKTRWWHTVPLDFLASGCSIHVWRDGRPLPCARCRSVRTGGHILLLVLRRKIKIETGLALARKQEEKCIFNGGGNGKSNARQCGERGA